MSPAPYRQSGSDSSGRNRFQRPRERASDCKQVTSHINTVIYNIRIFYIYVAVHSSTKCMHIPQYTVFFLSSMHRSLFPALQYKSHIGKFQAFSCDLKSRKYGDANARYCSYKNTAEKQKILPVVVSPENSYAHYFTHMHGLTLSWSMRGSGVHLSRDSW